MAYTLQLPNSDERVKMRSPLAVALLSLITLGIYHIVWWYKINREMSDYGRSRGRDLGQSPGLSTLALFPGGLIIIPALVTAWRGTQRVQGTARVSGREPLNGWIALILYIVFGLGWIAYLQFELNKVWRADAVPLPGEPAPPPLDDGMPPPLPADTVHGQSPHEPVNPEP